MDKIFKKFEEDLMAFVDQTKFPKDTPTHKMVADHTFYLECPENIWETVRDFIVDEMSAELTFECRDDPTYEDGKVVLPLTIMVHEWR